jgi:hypothetical protein
LQSNHSRLRRMHLELELHIAAILRHRCRRMRAVPNVQRLLGIQSRLQPEQSRMRTMRKRGRLLG